MHTPTVIPTKRQARQKEGPVYQTGPSFCQFPYAYFFFSTGKPLRLSSTL